MSALFTLPGARWNVRTTKRSKSIGEIDLDKGCCQFNATTKDRMSVPNKVNPLLFKLSTGWCHLLHVASWSPIGSSQTGHRGESRVQRIAWPICGRNLQQARAMQC